MGKLITVPIAIKINPQGTISLYLFALAWANWYFQMLESRCIHSLYIHFYYALSSWLQTFIASCCLLLICFNLLHNCGCALLFFCDTLLSVMHFLPFAIFKLLCIYRNAILFPTQKPFFNENSNAFSLPWGSLALPVICLSAVLLHRTIVPIAVLSSSTEPDS